MMACESSGFNQGCFPLWLLQISHIIPLIVGVVVVNGARLSIISCF